ncbi:MAG TPA: acetolactate synthase small subunit [Patescibacteria group bacterium]|nr:acetolactate synthase small subunit [Patescibacteria group bacterium]
MAEIKLYTIIIYTENKPGILYRIADVFLKRKINIESLTVSEIETSGLSRFTVVVKGNKFAIEKIVKQLYKIVEVTKVIENTDDAIIFRDTALIKIGMKHVEQRREIENFVSLFSAKIVFINEDAMIIEKTGTEEEITSLYTRLKPFGIKEYVRSGRIALIK